VLSERGISASPEKLKAVREYPNPKSVKDVTSFLGLAWCKILQRKPSR
jgi:hypothetical protein